jgi:hypothetical protein
MLHVYVTASHQAMDNFRPTSISGPERQRRTSSSSRLSARPSTPCGFWQAPASCQRLTSYAWLKKDGEASRSIPPLPPTRGSPAPSWPWSGTLPTRAWPNFPGSASCQTFLSGIIHRWSFEPSGVQAPPTGAQPKSFRGNSY